MPRGLQERVYGWLQANNWLDACHLKTKSGGQLITAVARDPNEEYFPLAYAVVEAETKDS